MPRRLAPLLFLFHLILPYVTAQPSQNTHAPVKAVAVPHPDVFIPLKEWKQQRLQDLESRVRKAEEQRLSPQRRLAAVCKPRARLLAFLSRIDQCPPLKTPSPSVVPAPPPDDPYSVSGRHPYGNENLSATFTATATPEEVQPGPQPAVSAVVVEQDVDAQLPQMVETTSEEPAKQTTQNDHLPPSVEPDELTGRIEDYIPKVLPKVLPNVIPKVNEIVKSIKEASLGYTTAGETPPDSLNPRGASSNADLAKCNNTQNSTSPQADLKQNVDSNGRSSKVEKLKGSLKHGKSQDARKGKPNDEHLLSAIVKHSNDSGVKEKPFNYASIDAGARVLAFSKDVVGAENVIQGNDDKYLLTPCAGSGIGGSRWVDLELSEEVILESIETGNFEYYSSSPRKVAVLGASTYPPKKWNVLGMFNFANVKTLQKFQIERRGVTRYLRVIFAGKQGTEYYCPISTVRAFGKNLIADWKDVFEKPPTRKGFGDNGVGSRNKAEKESEKLKAEGGKNTKKVEAKPSEKTETCPGDTCKDAGNTVITSESPVASPRHKAEEQEQEERRTQNGNVQSEEAGAGETSEEAPDQNRNNDGDGNSSRHVDVSSASNLEAEANHSKDQTDESHDGITDGDNNDANRAQYEDGEHVSEDDQVVIDALRSDTLTPVDGDDNIFRKVTRMLRLLELNQTLTNQYIDTQLAKFAVALSNAHSKSSNASEQVEGMQRQLEVLVVRLENRVEELRRASFRRDVLLCVMFICVALLLGTHWILWSAVSAARLHEDSGFRRSSLDSEAERLDRMLQTDETSQTSVTRVQGISSEGPSPIGRKKKRKGKKPFAGENMNGGYFSGSKLPPANGLASRRNGRSVSSVEISSVGGRRLGSTGGTFDILGQQVDQ